MVLSGMITRLVHITHLPIQISNLPYILLAALPTLLLKETPLLLDR
jgi:hypothetical protein